MTVDRVLLLEPRGFCAGVDVAVKALAWMTLLLDGPVFCFHQIVHNDDVVARFEDLGVVFVDDIDRVPAGAPLMLSAHGSAPTVVEAARSRTAHVVDAICPLVAKVHHEVRARTSVGHAIIYVGHRGHDEAEAVLGLSDALVPVTAPHAVPEALAQVPADAPLSLLAQTTLALHEWQAVRDAAAGVRPDLQTPARHDVCYATTNRQDAVRIAAPRCDAVIVVGSQSSSNTRALVDVAARAGVPTVVRVGRGDDLPAGLTGTVAVTAGASAPESSVREVLAALAPSHCIERIRVTSETEHFRLPRTLRMLIERAIRQDALSPALVAAYRGDAHMSADELLALIEPSRSKSARTPA
jgi:4-hydroxy-3-methylbut-2-enyl diphosphate reductase